MSKVKSLAHLGIMAGTIPLMFLGQKSQMGFADELAEKAKNTPLFGALNPYYKRKKLAYINEDYRRKNMNLLEKVGLDKIASGKDPVELMMQGIDKVGGDVSLIFPILAEIDAQAGIDKIAADLGIESDSEEYYEIPT